MLLVLLCAAERAKNAFSDALRMIWRTSHKSSEDTAETEKL